MGDGRLFSCRITHILPLMEKRKRIIVAILLVLAIGNFMRITPSGNVRSVEFLSILVMGALAGILLVDVMSMLGGKK